MRTKDDFHRLIDTIENEEVLKGYYKLVQRLAVQESGELWNSLTTEEQEELMVSYKESFAPENQIAHEDVKKQHVKWL